MRSRAATAYRSRRSDVAAAGGGHATPVLFAASVSLGAGLLIVLSACGIESIPFIAGPADDEVDVVFATSQISFLHNDEDNDTDEFEGYDLYYKLYEDTDGADQCGDNADCASDADYILNDPVQTGPSRLLGRDYRRMVPGNTPGAVPNIEVSNGNKGDEFEVTLDMSVLGAETQTAVVADWPDGPVELNRDVPVPGENRYKSFLTATDYADTDDDVGHIDTPIGDVISDDNLYATVYALGYGVDPGSLQALYSEPVFLGWVPIEPQ